MKSFTQKIKGLFPNKKIQYKNPLTITVNLKFDFSNLNGFNSIDSALSRPFRVLINENRPIGRINHLFYQDKNTQECYILGSFIYTFYAHKQKRLIFFPGINNKKILWHSKANPLPVQGNIDHFTIEPDLKTWHYTTLLAGKKEKKWLPSNNILKIKPNLFYWFGISIANTNKLENLYKELVLSFPINANHVNNCSKYLMDAKEKSCDHIVSQPDQEADSNNEFIHFDFLIDKRFFRKLIRKLKGIPKNICAIPHGESVRIDTEPPTQDFPVKYHPVKIKDFRGDILVLVSKHKGKLSQEVIISAKS